VDILSPGNESSGKPKRRTGTRCVRFDGKRFVPTREFTVITHFP
jgi:hypothetical protein